MKSGQLIGGIAIGALIGVGVGFLLGVDSEKKNQWLKALSDRVWGDRCNCGDEGEPSEYEKKAE